MYNLSFGTWLLYLFYAIDKNKYYITDEGAVYKGCPANGEGGWFEISDIPGRGEAGVVCESSDV